jgi:hypothetical protein
VGRKSFTTSKPVHSRIVELATITAFLCCGGLLTGCAIVSARFHWAAWLGLVPVFAAIRRLSGVRAFLGGALWGGAVYLGAMIASGASFPITPLGCMHHILLPAGYVYFMAVFSRRYWYSPLALALGWILVELAVNVSGAQPGLISAEHISSPFLHVLTDFFGSGFIAFAVAYAGASVITIASSLGVRWRLSAIVIWRPTECRLVYESLSNPYATRHLRPVRPRGPPSISAVYPM